jgi:hypothetical protein
MSRDDELRAEAEEAQRVGLFKDSGGKTGRPTTVLAAANTNSSVRPYLSKYKFGSTTETLWRELGGGTTLFETTTSVFTPSLVERVEHGAWVTWNKKGTKNPTTSCGKC